MPDTSMNLWWTCVRPAGWARWQTWCVRCGDLIEPGAAASFWTGGQESRQRLLHAACTPPVQPGDRRCARCWSHIRQPFGWRDAGRRLVPTGPPTCIACPKDTE